MQPDTLTRREYKVKIYVKNILKKFMWDFDPKPTEKQDTALKKISPGPQHLP